MEMRSMRMAAAVVVVLSLCAGRGARPGAREREAEQTRAAQPSRAPHPSTAPRPASAPQTTGEVLDYAMLAKIREEGLQRSQVMEHVVWLSDVFGPRVTGSPAFADASAWTMKKFGEWGLANIHQEKFRFGKGWTLERFHAHLVSPQVQPLVGYPKAWSPSTKGQVSGDVVRVTVRTEGDFERYRGKLSGTIVLTQAAREVRMLEGRLVLRMTDADEAEARTTPIPAEADRPDSTAERVRLQARLEAFLQAEGVLAILDRGADTDRSAGGSDLSWETQRVDGGTIFPGNTGSRGPDAGTGLPAVTLAVEHYNRLVRLIDKGVTPRVELRVDARFHEEVDMNGINTLAEIPGTDKASEVVLLGAHLDSTHAATGATDNATGVAAMMEAVRILQAVGARPRRTIRVGLWGGEEQGLLGSRAYAREHYADPQTLATKPEHATFSANFNIDNGTGRIRGIWMQGNLAMEPIFAAWVAPLADLGVTILGPRSVSSTDHVAFDDIGLPAFQFIQERLEYNSRSHHSNMDFTDRVQRDDMVQMATVVATIAYNAAMRDERLPRKAMPAPRAARPTAPGRP